MTDQTTPDVTDDDRREAYEWAKSVESNLDTWGGRLRAPARVILDAVPAPPRPTLADMSDEERAGCRRMQADVEGRSERYVIAAPYDNDADVALIGPDWEFDWIEPECVTPRPDLPRMEWPGTEKPTPALALPGGWRLADHKDHGRVIVTNTTPNSGGHVYFTVPTDGNMGYGCHFCDPAELTYIDQEVDQ